MRGRSRAFTLIEVMIAVAILAILLAVPITTRNTCQNLQREADYRFALRNARLQMARLRALPFDRLPPRLITVGTGGRIDLGQPDLVPGSVTLHTLAGQPLPRPLQVQAEEGRLQVDPSLAGQRVLVNYSFYAPDSGEAHTVPRQPPCEVRLANAPVVRVERVLLARGESTSPLDYHLDRARGVLSLPASAAGRVVVVDYLGERLRNQVSGRFVDQDLEPSDRPGPFKLLTLQESYGGPVMRLRLDFLKVAP